MYKLDHPQDLAQFQSIKRRQRLDQERMQRIFDPKVRIMGVDVKGIEEQTRIKHELRQLDDQRSKSADKEAKETNEILQLLDAKAVACKRALDQEIDQFRQDQQQPYMRRDFDLYDPCALKNDVLPGTAVSGMQTFQGQDEDFKARTQAQKNQLQLWTWHAMREKQAARDHASAIDNQREALVVQNNHVIQFEMEHERLHRKQVAMDHAKFNLKLAMDKKLRVAQEKQSETEMNHGEILFNVTSDLLTERPAPPQAFPHSIRIDAFKGMNPDQLCEIQSTRQKQVAEARSIAEKRHQVDRDWDMYQISVSRATMLMDRERKRAERALQLQLMARNQVMALESRHRKSFLDKVVYTNPPTEDFFSQFNTTSR